MTNKKIKKDKELEKKWLEMVDRNLEYISLKDKAKEFGCKLVKVK